jgi:hypothetical protein
LPIALAPSPCHLTCVSRFMMWRPNWIS